MLSNSPKATQLGSNTVELDPDLSVSCRGSLLGLLHHTPGLGTNSTTSRGMG